MVKKAGLSKTRRRPKKRDQAKARREKIADASAELEAR
jgi:hypothetical protein